MTHKDSFSNGECIRTGSVWKSGRLVLNCEIEICHQLRCSNKPLEKSIDKGDNPVCHLLQCRHEDREDHAGWQQRSLVRSWPQESDIRKESWLVDQAGCISRRWFLKAARSTGKASRHWHGFGRQADSTAAGKSGAVQACARRVVSIRTPCRLGCRLGG